MSCSRWIKCFATVVATVLAMATARGATADEARANELFVQGVLAYRDTKAASADAPPEAYSETRRLFDLVLLRYPETRAAEILTTEEAPGGIDRSRLPQLRERDEPEGWNDGKRGIARDLVLAYEADLAALGRVADAADYALLAAASYAESYTDPVLTTARDRGWTMVWRYERQAPKLVAGIPQPGAAVAILFRSERGKHVLSFRGTTNLGDWVSNINGTLSPDPISNAQIDIARGIAREVAASHPDVIFTGHSLGGRLSEVSNLATGNPAVIFNAAPLSAADKLKAAVAGVDNPNPVHRFRSPEDTLTALFSRDETVVANLPRVEGGKITDALASGFTHGSRAIADAMQEVRRARDEGWVAALMAELRVVRATEKAPRPTVSTALGPRISIEGSQRQMVSDTGCRMSQTLGATEFKWSGACPGGQPQGDGVLTLFRNGSLLERLRLGTGTEFRLSQGALYWAKDLGLLFQKGGVAKNVYGSFSVQYVYAPHTYNFQSPFSVEGILRAGYDTFMREQGFKGENAQVTGLAVRIVSIENGKNKDENVATVVFNHDGTRNKSRWAYTNETQAAFEKERDNFNKKVEAARREQALARAAANVNAGIDSRRDALLAEAKKLIEGEAGTLAALATAMETDSIKTLARLEDGARLVLPASTDFKMLESGEERRFRVSHQVFSPLSALESERRQSLMKIDFSWDKWFDQTQSVGKNATTYVTCRFKTLDDIPKAQKELPVELVSFSRSQRSYQIVLDCG